MKPDQIKNQISSKLNCKSISVDGDGVHFEAKVVSDIFIGLNRVARHRLIYSALGDKMREEIHALSIKTYTEEEWKEKLSGKI